MANFSAIVSIVARASVAVVAFAALRVSTTVPPIRGLPIPTWT
ncbi:hypothetical protein [Corynebacterium sp.]